MISIIIPAHNEEAVIERCLAALLDGAEPGELQIVVACNGCTDATAERACAFGPPVQVIEIEQASKTAAINAAERIAGCFPRLYVDGDVVLPLDSVRRIAAVLEGNGCLLASPVVQTDTGASSSAVRAFYDVWLRLPYNRVMVGTGVYALSQQGRERFGEFPPIIADDGFVRSRFSPEERMAVPDATVTVVAPRTLGDLIRVKTRSRLGGYELARKFGRPAAPDVKKPGLIIKSLPWGYKLAWQVSVYLWVNMIVRIRARRWLRNLSCYQWQLDDASRMTNGMSQVREGSLD